MYSVLIFTQAILALLLVCVILIQKTSSDGLAGIGGRSGGLDGIMSAKSSTSFIAKVTAVLIALFFVNCIVLANISNKTSKRSIVDTIQKEQLGRAGNNVPVAE